MPCKIRLFCVSDQIRRHIGVYDSSQHQPVTDLDSQQKVTNGVRELRESAGVPSTLRERVFTPPILPYLCCFLSSPSVYFPLQKYRLNIFNRTYDETARTVLGTVPSNNLWIYHPFYTSSLCKKIGLQTLAQGQCGRLDERNISDITWHKSKTPAEVMTRADGLVRLGWTSEWMFWGSTSGFRREAPAYIFCVSHFGWPKPPLSSLRWPQGKSWMESVFVSRWGASLKATT